MSKGEPQTLSGFSPWWLFDHSSCSIIKQCWGDSDGPGPGPGVWPADSHMMDAVSVSSSVIRSRNVSLSRRTARLLCGMLRHTWDHMTSLGSWSSSVHLCLTISPIGDHSKPSKHDIKPLRTWTGPHLETNNEGSYISSTKASNLLLCQHFLHNGVAGSPGPQPDSPTIRYWLLRVQ